MGPYNILGGLLGNLYDSMTDRETWFPLEKKQRIAAEEQAAGLADKYKAMRQYGTWGPTSSNYSPEAEAPVTPEEAGDPEDGSFGRFSNLALMAALLGQQKGKISGGMSAGTQKGYPETLEMRRPWESDYRYLRS